MLRWLLSVLVVLPSVITVEATTTRGTVLNWLSLKLLWVLLEALEEARAGLVDSPTRQRLSLPCVLFSLL
jgi:hypothetical protein